MSIKAHLPMDWYVLRVVLALKTGWTLAYVDTLSTADVLSIGQVLDGSKRANGN